MSSSVHATADMKPLEFAPVTVRLTATASAPAGTTVASTTPVDVYVGTSPVTCNRTHSLATRSPLGRVSMMRAVSTVVNDDADPAADTPMRPPPPRVTATAAPMAAQRDRMSPRLFLERSTTIPFHGAQYRTGFSSVPHYLSHRQRALRGLRVRRVRQSTTRTLMASGPLRPSPTSNSTFWSS